MPKAGASWALSHEFFVEAAPREEDMESYLISPASGSIFMECFRRDGVEETRELAWDRKPGGSG